MAKRILDLVDFSGGINSRINKKEINDNDVAKSVGFMYDVPGIIRGMGAATALKYDGTNVITTVSDSSYSVGASNGYGLGFVSFDKPTQIIILKTSEVVSGVSVGVYLSNSNTTGDWHTMTSNKFVVKVYRIDNGVTPKLIYCYVIRPGDGATGLFGDAGVMTNIVGSSVQLYTSASYTGTSPSSSVILAATSFPELFSTADAAFDYSEGLNWTVENPAPAIFPDAWTITTDGSDTLVLDSSGATNIPMKVTNHNFTSALVDNEFYLLKITFSSDLANGNLNVSLNGRGHTLTPADVDSNIIYKILKTGSASEAAPEGGLSILNVPSSTTATTATITAISLTVANFSFGSEDDTLSDNLGENVLMYADAGTNKVKYFSYDNGALIEIMIDSATIENEKEVLVLKDDDGSATTEISPIIYSIEGAVKLVDANLKTLKADLVTARKPFESKYVKFIDRKYFNDKISYFEWVAEPSDIDAPTDGLIKSDGNPLFSNQMKDGFINMLAYKQSPSSNQVLFKEFLDMDGVNTGTIDDNQKKFCFPITALKWNTITEGNYPIPALPDGSPANGCVGFTKRWAKSWGAVRFEYHGGLDNTLSHFEAFDKVIDMSNPNAGAILVTAFISEDAYANLRDELPLYIEVGSFGDYPSQLGASRPEIIGGEPTPWEQGWGMARWAYNKVDITPGWTTYRLEMNQIYSIEGAFDPKFIKDVGVTWYQKEGTYGGTGSMFAHDQFTGSLTNGHHYLFYFVGSDHKNNAAVSAVNYDADAYIDTSATLGGLPSDGGANVSAPLTVKFALDKEDFFDITAVDASPDGLFNGDTQMSYYRNRALVTVKDKAAAGILLSDYFVPGDLVLITTGSVSGDITNDETIFENYFCACVKEVLSDTQQLSLTLPMDQMNILTTFFSSHATWAPEGYTGFNVSNFDATCKLFLNPSIPEADGVQGPIVHVQGAGYTADQPDSTKTGVGANYSYPPVPFAVSNISYEKAVDGDWTGKFSFYYTFVYDDNQESKMFEFNSLSSSYQANTNVRNEIELNEESLYMTFCLNEATITGGWNHATAGRRRINKANIYYSKILEEAESGDISYYFLGELDLNKGFRLSGTTAHNTFQKIEAGSIKDTSLSTTASDIIFKHDTNDEIYSDDGEVNFGKFFEVGQRLLIEPTEFFFIDFSWNFFDGFDFEFISLVGAEMITATNAKTFAGSGNWATLDASGADVTISVGAGVLTVATQNDVEVEGCQLTVSNLNAALEVGATYRVHATLDQTSGATTPEIRFSLGGKHVPVRALDGAPVDGTINTDAQVYYADIKVINTTGSLQIFNPYLSSATTFTVDDVSVTKKLDHVTIKTISTGYGSTNDKMQVEEDIIVSGTTSAQTVTMSLMGDYGEFYAISSIEQTKSKATIEVIDYTLSTNDFIKLFDAEGNGVTYQIDTSDAVVDGSKIGGGGTDANYVNVGTNGATTNALVAARFVEAINATTGNSGNSLTLNITASVSDAVITLSQDTPGPDGDTAIINYLTATDFIVSPGFTGNASSAIPYSELAPIKIDYFPQIEVFETKALYKNDVEYTSAKYKAYTINSGILYAGNVRQGGKVYPDRILKSLPNRYDLFPSDNFIEVTVNDGDEIITLSSFNDRILQFKRGSLAVINVSSSLEFLENTFTHLGVHTRTAVYTTDKGVIFANRSGVYVFVGEGEPVKLTSKLSDADWKAFVNNTPEQLLLMYIPHKDQIVVGNTASEDGYIVDLRTKSVAFGEDIVRVGDQFTNVVHDTKNNMPVYLQEGADDIGITSNNDLTFRTFYNDEDDTYLATVTHKIIEPATSADIVSATGMGIEFKHLDFGSPEIRKKIHAITVSTKDSDGNIKLQYSSDMGNSWADIAASEGDSTITDYAGNRGSFSRQKFSVSLNNVYTLGLRIVPTTGSETSHTAEFAVQDISIVYRLKSAK